MVIQRSISSYPSDWPEISRRVKESAGWRCVRCGHRHDTPNGYMLTVHHLDMNKANCEWWNTPALCQRCHLSIQARVVMERPWFLEHSEWFRPYVAGYYAHVHGHLTNRKWVMENLDMLLAYGRSTTDDRDV